MNGKHENLMYTMREIASDCQDSGMTYTDAKKLFLKSWIEQALRKNGNNQCAVAAKEGIHRNTLARLIREVGVQSNGRWKQRAK